MVVDYLYLLAPPYRCDGYIVIARNVYCINQTIDSLIRELRCMFLLPVSD